MDEAQRRFSLIEGKPPALPGCCFICSGEDREWFIDLARDIEFHGAAYMCSECFKEFASMVNFVPVGDLDLVNRQVQELKVWDAEIAQVSEDLDRVYRELGSSLSGLGDFRSHLVLDPSDVSVPAEETDGVHGPDEPGVSTGEGETSEPSNESGLADVHATEPRDESFTFGFD